MQLRSTAAGRKMMQQEARPAFEEGAALVFSKWTAMGLAVENEWGGRNSRQKADDLIEEVIQWFYSRKGPNPLLPRWAGVPMTVPQRTTAGHLPALPRSAAVHDEGSHTRQVSS